MKMKKILLVAAPIGSGHQKAAEAIIEEFRVLAPACSIKFIDIFDFLPKKIVGLCLKGYFKSLVCLPSLYKFVYAWGNRSKLAETGTDMLSCILAYQLKRYLKAYRWCPDAVICTHVSAAAAVNCWLRQDRDTNIYHAAVVTDFVIHRLWINETIDDYFIYDSSMLRAEMKRLVQPHKIQALGIPVAKPFAALKKKAANFSLGAEKRILIMGGGEGLLPAPALLKALNEVNFRLKIVILTGRNQKMKQSLRREKALCRHCVEVKGFVDNVAEFMQSSDLLISKAGGSSLSEALSIGLPMLIYCPLPGQERANMDFLQEKGLAVEIRDIDALPREIDKIFRKGGLAYKSWQARMKTAAKPHAAEHIAKYILNKLYN